MPILGDSHICPHKGEIEQITKALNGNGNQGLIKDVTECKIEMTAIKDDITKLATSYSALAKSEIKKDALEKARLELEEKKLAEREKRSTIFKRLGTIFAIIFGAVATFYIIIDHLST
jgi:hypothetical protein